MRVGFGFVLGALSAELSGIGVECACIAHSCSWAETFCCLSCLLFVLCCVVCLFACLLVCLFACLLVYFVAFSACILIFPGVDFCLLTRMVVVLVLFICYFVVFLSAFSRPQVEAVRRRKSRHRCCTTAV